jgi:hypothetical protein
MHKYQVQVVETTRRLATIEVEAKDVFEAEEIARKAIIIECQWRDDELPMRRQVTKIRHTE